MDVTRGWGNKVSLKGERRLSFADWRGGDKLWLIDVVTPFGGPEAVIKDLSETVFPDKEFKALVPDKEKEGIRVVTFKGKVLQEQEAAE